MARCGKGRMNEEANDVHADFLANHMRHGMARRGTAGLGMAWSGKAGHGRVR